jgi:hypothetical protein
MYLYVYTHGAIIILCVCEIIQAGTFQVYVHNIQSRLCLRCILNMTAIRDQMTDNYMHRQST